MLGSAAWEIGASDSASRIRKAAARKGARAVGPRIELFYAERLDEAFARNLERVLLPLARVFVERGGRPLGELEMHAVLRRLAALPSLPGGAASLGAALSDLGLLWRGPAGWEMGIPGFADYLLGLESGDGSSG